MNNLFQRIESARDLGDKTGYSSVEVLLAQTLQKLEALKPGAGGAEVEITHESVRDAVHRAFGIMH